jgi:YHS domain-containing protein
MFNFSNKKSSSSDNTLAMSRRQALTVVAGLAASAVILPTSALAAKDEILTSLLGNKAVDGYDTVAYFTEGKPVEGSSEFSTEYKGAEWQFASQENLDLFLGNPEKYAPAYGGYCAYAVALGSTANGDPEQWEIYEDRLYLNVNAEIQAKWTADKPGFIEQSEANWPNVLN